MHDANTLPYGQISERLLRLRDVLELTALSRATLYREIDHGAFPKPIKFGSAARWPASDVANYIEARIQARESGA